MMFRTIYGFFIVCILSIPSAASDRKTYPMDVSAAGMQKIIFDVQEGDFILRGAPDAKEIKMMVSIDRMFSNSVSKISSNA